MVEDEIHSSPTYLSSHAELEDDEPGIAPKQSERPVKWRDLPNKKQLAILTIARLLERLSQTSLQAYMFYQLKSFDPNLPGPTIYFQAGMLQASFTAAQFPHCYALGTILGRWQGWSENSSADRDLGCFGLVFGVWLFEQF